MLIYPAAVGEGVVDCDVREIAVMFAGEFPKDAGVMMEEPEDGGIPSSCGLIEPGKL